MRDMVTAGEVDALVAERVWKELARALTEKNPEQFFLVLQSCVALQTLFPEFTADNFHLLERATKVTTDAEIRFAVLCSSLDC